MQPEFQDKFLCYKQLKKVLKSLPSSEVDDGAQRSDEGHGAAAQSPLHNPPTSSSAATSATERNSPLTPEEVSFVKMLNEELEKFNEFYMEKEEEYVMHMKRLEDELEQLTGAGRVAETEELDALHVACVRFHGTLVLLQNWSALNYAALVKILKKHDKHSKLALRSPYLANVLNQPFYSTEVLSELVAGTESLYTKVMVKQKEHGTASSESSKALEGTAPRLINWQLQQDVLEMEVQDLDPSIMRQTQTALSMWGKVKSNSVPVPDEDKDQEITEESDTGFEQDSTAMSPRPQKMMRVE